MGSSQSIQEEDEEGDEDDEAEEGTNRNPNGSGMNGPLLKKVLEQEPEMLPCYPSASPLSPQLSSSGTPHFDPSIKVWDPYNFLVPPPPPPPPQPLPLHFTRNFSFDAVDDDQMATEVFLISHGEWEMNLKPELVAGRCHQSTLTPLGRRQGRALSVFLNSQGIRFNAVYTSPLPRARATAISVCQEMRFVEEEIQSCEAVSDMSWGEWEGCLISEIYTPEVVNLMESQQPDFSPPNGESLRHVEFRMAQFLNLLLPARPNTAQIHTDSVSLTTESKQQHQQHQHQNYLKTFGKSRLMVMTTTSTTTTTTTTASGGNDVSSRSNSVFGRFVSPFSSSSSSCYCIGVFTHSWPIKCAVAGVLGCSPVMSQKICVDDSSVTVLSYSWRTGWKVKRSNDTAHLRLL